MTRIFDSSQIGSQLGNLQKALSNASRKTGISFDFLVKTAARESGLQATAKAKNSSATGLFQFVEQTWLGMVSRHGAKYGLAKESAQIVQSKTGRFSVEKAIDRNRILNMRNDPAASAAMAAELTAENSKTLKAKLGREPSETELYTAHFMGAGRAADLVLAAKATPEKSAVELFSREARANKNIFYTPDGVARNVKQVLKELGRLHVLPTPDFNAQSETGQQVAIQNTGSTPSWHLSGGWVRSPLLQLSPVLVQLLAELATPEAPEQINKK